MRLKSACTTCRQRRKRCIRSAQGTSCDYCIERNLQCILSKEIDSPKDGYEPIEPRQGYALTHKCKLLPPTTLCYELIELYFRHIHVSFHVLFHKPSFIKAFNDGSLPKILLLSVMGMSARFSQHESLADVDPPQRGRPFTKEAERLLNLHDISLTSIQACLILGASAVVEGDGSTESVYFSVASRMTMLLDLPNAPASTRIEQEVNFRVWWSVYETDTWSSTATRLPKLMPLRLVPLAMAEKRFLELSSTLTACQHAVPVKIPAQPQFNPPYDSLTAHSSVVNQLFPRIDEINTQTVSGELRGDRLFEAVEQISLQLKSWESGLPINMTNTPQNLAYWTREGYGHTFVNLHMHYYHLCQLLFYQFLHGGSVKSHNPRRANQYAMMCAQYATDLCNLIHVAAETPGAEVLSSISGHVLTIASTVQLYTLLFSAETNDVQHARRSLERNFEFLTRLKTFWPCIEISFSRFREFHNACLRSQDESQFQMDQWMLRFLLEFATPLSERYVEENAELRHYSLYLTGDHP